MNNNNYNYSRLGTRCEQSTRAITSNTKFIPPMKPIYFQPYSYSLQYPSSEETIPATIDDESKEVVENRTYFGKSFGPQQGVRPSNEYVSGGCKNCQGK